MRKHWNRFRRGLLLLLAVGVLTGCDAVWVETLPVQTEMSVEIETKPVPEETLPQDREVLVLDVKVQENREHELVFSFQMDDFIDSYNSFYSMDKGMEYLSPADEWSALTYDSAVHSDHETVIYKFSENEKMWSLPTMSVYVPARGDGIQEITVNFDEHSRTEDLYRLYENMCFYAVKVFFPDFSDEKIVELYTTLNQLAYDNVFSNEEGYGADSVPCALYYKDGVGLYSYFAVGEWVHLCIIPVTEETIEEFKYKGVQIHEIQE